jgi:hypothetical protein
MFIFLVVNFFGSLQFDIIQGWCFEGASKFVLPELTVELLDSMVTNAECIVNMDDFTVYLLLIFK